jgi:TrmH family RNA methyltransferase
MITSIQNPRVKRVRALQSQSKFRRELGSFVVEGVRLAEEAFEAGWQVTDAFYTSNINERGWVLLAGLQEKGITVEEASSQVFRTMSNTKTPQGILLVLSIQSLPLPQTPDFILILDQIRNPGNLGTILRTAQAADVQAVFTPIGTVDPYAPKVIRSAMGAHFHLPVFVWDWEQINAYCRDNALQIILADTNAQKMYTQLDLRVPTALLVGSEAHGAGRQARQLNNTPVLIPMPGKAESLNAAVAAAILIFEVVRQRHL